MKNQTFAILAGIIIVGAGIAFLLIPQYAPLIRTIFETKYIEVQKIVIDYLPDPSFYPVNMGIPIKITAKNLANTNLDYVGIEIDGNSYGILRPMPPIPGMPLLPAGQTSQLVYDLNNFSPVSDHIYNIKLTFTMADGKYQNYFSSYTMPHFQGSAKLTLFKFVQGNLFGFSSLSVTITNTGNLPITSITYSLNNNLQGTWLQNGYEIIKPGDSSSFESSWPYSNFVKGRTYTLTVIVTYLYGNTSTLTGSFIA